MSWYLSAQSSDAALAKTIAQWLVQAYVGPVDMRLVHNDLDSLMPTIDDEGSLNEAVASGETMARTQLRQSGDLTPIQQDVINNVRLRLSNPPQQMNNGGFTNVQPENQQQTEAQEIL